MGYKYVPRYQSASLSNVNRRKKMRFKLTQGYALAKCIPPGMMIIRS